MEFRDLRTQYETLKFEIEKGILNICSNARFVSGPEVSELEERLADYVGVKHCITCANGTDAITLALKAWGLGEKDAVFVPDFTFFSSGECPAGEGCTCVFVDVDERTFNIAPSKLENAIVRVKEDGLYTPKAVIAVDLFGLPAEYDKIREICEKYGLLLLEDGAQGFGGRIGNRKACSFGDISTTSFFPAKPLGCYGDGGAVFTDNDEWAELIRSYAVHGKSGNNKYDNIRVGRNSRLDTIQAAVLLVKLKAFNDYELKDINEIASIYLDEFKKNGIDKIITLPKINEGYFSSWAQFTIVLPKGTDRDEIRRRLKEKDIPTMVYYMKPMHEQKAFEGTNRINTQCPVTEDICSRVLSLPIHPYMTKELVLEVVGEFARIYECE